MTLKKALAASALVLVMSMPLAANAGERDHGPSFPWGGPIHNAPEIDGGDMALAMTLLGGVVALLRRRSQKAG